MTPDVRQTDDKARITLPRGFANCTVVLEARGENEVVIRKVRIVPVEGREPEVISLSDRAWEQFADAIENPPPPNEALRGLMGGG